MFFIKNVSALYVKSLLLILFLLIPTIPYAKIIDYELTNSSKCGVHFKRIEKIYNIPNFLLHAISLQETGKSHKVYKERIVWPWAVNVEGVGYFFDSKNEAIEFTKNKLNQGIRNIDIGCMQINLKYHPHAFKSIEEAFEPKYNIEYGAKFLKSKYEQYNSWNKAIATYHSSTQELGNSYLQSVLKIFANIKSNKSNIPNDIKIWYAQNEMKTKNHEQVKRNEINTKHGAKNSRIKYLLSERSERNRRRNIMVYVPRVF